MGRSPCCSKEGLNRGAWTAQEDKILRDYIHLHGEGKWRNLPQKAGLKRCGKSCRLRWLNYLRPDIKRGNISQDEEELIIRLHKLLGNRWSLIAGRLPGRTDNEIKNYWNTNLGKKVKDGNSNTSSEQPIEKPKDQSTSKVTSPLSSSSTPNMSKKEDSLVIRPKASKCSKLLFLDPPPLHSSTQLQNNYCMAELKAEAELLFKDNDAVIIPPIDENELSTDLLLDFNIEDVFLHDLLNSDFSEVCDFSCNNHVDLLPFSDQPLSSLEIVKDVTQRCSSDETNAATNNFYRESDHGC